MKTTENRFVSKYKRKSQSPWEDDSKILWLADYRQDEGKLRLDYGHYIYLHRDEVGRVLGISISKQMLEEHPEFESRYLEDVEMYAMLLLYREEISYFCGLFSDEFQELFLLPPEEYFTLAEGWWLNKLESYC